MKWSVRLYLRTQISVRSGHWNLSCIWHVWHFCKLLNILYIPCVLGVYGEYKTFVSRYQPSASPWANISGITSYIRHIHVHLEAMVYILHIYYIYKLYIYIYIFIERERERELHLTYDLFILIILIISTSSTLSKCFISGLTEIKDTFNILITSTECNCIIQSFIINLIKKYRNVVWIRESGYIFTTVIVE